MKRILPFLFLLTGLAYSQPVEHEWELAKEKNGITVYTRKVEGEVLKEYKAETVIKASPLKTLNVFTNIENNTLWMNHVRSSQLLEQVNENEFYYYAEIEVPWPMVDRDMIVNVLIEPQEDGYICHLSNAPEYLPLKKSFVRIPQFRGSFSIIQLGPEKVRIVEQSFTSPGGNVPGWLANSTVTDGPVKSLTKLRELIEGL